MDRSATLQRKGIWKQFYLCVQHRKLSLPFSHMRKGGPAPEGIHSICVANGLVWGPISFCCLLSVAGVPWGSLAKVHFSGKECPVRGFYSTRTFQLPRSGLINGFGQKTEGSSQFGKWHCCPCESPWELGASVPSKLPRREQQQSYEVGKIRSYVSTVGICVKDQSPHLYWVGYSHYSGERFKLYLEMGLSEFESGLTVDHSKQKNVNMPK